jgi:hypothetical protein
VSIFRFIFHLRGRKIFFGFSLPMADPREEQNSTPAKKRGRPGKSVGEVVMSPCEDGIWLYDEEKDLVIYVCHYCFEGRCPQVHLEQDMRGRLVEPPGDILGKVHAHVKTKTHLTKRDGPGSGQMTFLQSLEAADLLKRDAAETLLDMARFALTTGSSFRVFGAPGAAYLLRRSPEVAKEIKSLTHCSGPLPQPAAFRKTYSPAAFSIHLTVLRELVKGRMISLIVDESPDRISRPVVNVLLQTHFEGKILTFLAASKRITTEHEESVNQTTLRFVLDECLRRLGAQWSQVKALASDSVAYNAAMFRNLREENQEVIHVRDVAHLLNDAIVKALKASLPMKEAADFAANLSITLKSRSLRAEWRAFVESNSLVHTRQPPRFSKTRWYALVSVVMFAFEYLQGTLAFIRRKLRNRSDNCKAAKRLVALCSEGSDMDLLALFTGKLQLLMEELDRLAMFTDSAQKEMTTFGSIGTAIESLQADLGVTAAANMEVPRHAAAVVDWRLLPSPTVKDLTSNLQTFRDKVQAEFREMLGKHFFADERILPLTLVAQCLDPKSKVFRTATWADIAFGAEWWCRMRHDEDGKLLGKIKFQYEKLFMGKQIPGDVRDGIHYWHQLSDSPMRDLAAMALDLLSIPIGSSGVERSFSEQHQTDTQEATSASPELAEMKAMMYQNRHIELGTEYAHVRESATSTWFDGHFAGRILRMPKEKVLPDGLVSDAHVAPDDGPQLLDDEDEPYVSLVEGADDDDEEVDF